MKNSQCSCGSFNVIPSKKNEGNWSCLECLKLTPFNFDVSQGLPCRCGSFNKTDLGDVEKCGACGYKGLKSWKADLIIRPRHRLKELFVRYGKGVKVRFHNRPKSWYFEITDEDATHPGMFRGREFQNGVETDGRAYWGSEADDIGWYVVGEK